MIRPTPGTMRVRAEPVASSIGPNGERRTTIATLSGSGRFPWIGQRGGELSPPAFASQGVYDQVVLPPAEPGVGPPELFDPLTLDNLRNSQSVPRLQAWSRQLLGC